MKLIGRSETLYPSKLGSVLEPHRLRVWLSCIALAYTCMYKALSTIPRHCNEHKQNLEKLCAGQVVLS